MNFTERERRGIFLLLVLVTVIDLGLWALHRFDGGIRIEGSPELGPAGAAEAAGPGEPGEAPCAGRPDGLPDGEAPGEGPEQVPEFLRIDLNRASALELDRLPGIGPQLAERIVAYRAEHGPFRRVEDLLNVRGIGPKTLDKLAAWLYLSDEETGEADS